MPGPDLDTGIGALQKILDALRSLPIWLLGGLAGASFVLWKFPAFPVPVPSALRDWLPASAFTFGLITVCKLTSDLVSVLIKRRRGGLARDKMRLDNIYLPMGAMFLTRHVDVTVGIFDPPFRIKMKKAWAILAHRKRRLHVVAAAKTLFEKKRSTSAGIEFGGEFPLREILAIVRNYITIADGELQAKVRRADRSRYEEWGNNSLLTEEEFELFNHIVGERDKLMKRTRWVS
ncbi:hypothetical protein NKH52_28435 [Mesorhizobium sp. M1066]|uniref:hypothetical protein n=1 Tax=unclassified Mesorhizobium TaxID=325217 RepID=UPI00333DD1DB